MQAAMCGSARCGASTIACVSSSVSPSAEAALCDHITAVMQQHQPSVEYNVLHHRVMARTILQAAWARGMHIFDGLLMLRATPCAWECTHVWLLEVLPPDANHLPALRTQWPSC